MVSGRRPSKTRGFLRFSNRSRNPLRTLGWSTFENSWFFAIFKSPARPSADFGPVDLQKLVVFYDFQIARATLCGLWAGRPSKTRGFLRFSNRPRDPLRTLGRSTFESSWFFAILKSPARPSADFRLVDLRKLAVFCVFKSPARPSADFGLVDLRKLVVFCDFQIARATLCGLWAGRPSKTRGFLRFSNRPRDPLRTLGRSTFENSWFFAILKSPARPSADFRLVDLRKLAVFCVFKSPARPSADFGLVDLRKLVVFLRFSNRPRDPLRTLGWSTFENSWFFAIFKSPARPFVGWSTLENS